MMAFGTVVRAALACTAALIFSACDEDPGATGDAALDAGPDAGGGGTDTVELSFEARVGEPLFDCSQTYTDLGSSKVSANLSDFRLYLSNVRLIDEADEEVALALTQDGKFQYQEVALLDFEDGSGHCENGTADTNALIKGTAPAGSYKGVRFEVGIPSALNHANLTTKPAPLNLTGLWWGWQAGHKFLRIDARVATDAGAPPTFLIHLGSTNCSGKPEAGEEVSCAHPNRATIELGDFDPSSQKIVIDYAKLVADVALDADQGGEAGCMGSADDPECQGIFEALGVDAQSGQPAGAQRVFSVEAR